MIWLVEIALIFLGIGLLVAVVGRRAKTTRQAEAIDQRVAAYTQTIRRTAEPAEFGAMAHMELRDVLEATVRRLQTERSNRVSILSVAGIGEAIATIFFGAQEGIQAFALSAAIAGLALDGLNLVLERRSDTGIENSGMDKDRLLIS